MNRKKIGLEINEPLEVIDIVKKSRSKRQSISFKELRDKVSGVERKIAQLVCDHVETDDHTSTSNPVFEYHVKHRRMLIDHMEHLYEMFEDIEKSESMAP